MSELPNTAIDPLVELLREAPIDVQRAVLASLKHEARREVEDQLERVGTLETWIAPQGTPTPPVGTRKGPPTPPFTLPGARPASDPRAENDDRIDRFPVDGELGSGGMGRVLRVTDPDLHRPMALKIIRLQAADEKGLRRFYEEARLTAQLQHPGIVAVHHLGQLDDGRVYYTMEEVRGRTLQEVIAELHGPVDDAEERLPLRRVIGWFRAACEAVAYAHSRGVIHRDLKPDNIMIGAFGEVRVMDWGIAKPIERLMEGADSEDLTLIDPERPAHETEAGVPVGTALYMAPEQARGDLHRLGPPTDVCALGAVLFQILSGRPPRSGSSYLGVMMQVVHDERRPLEGPLPIPEALREVCDRAMAYEPEDRFPDASAMANALDAWLEGARKRADALALVAQADRLIPEIQRLREKARQSRRDGETHVARLAPFAPIADKRPAWAQLDAAVADERAAERAAADQEQLLRAALSHVPELQEAHERLAALYRAHHAQAERNRDAAETIRYEVLLQGHAQALPHGHPRRQPLLDYLTGDGRLSLRTDPPGASVRLLRYERIDRMLQASLVDTLGHTPLRAQVLPRGSYVVELDAPGYQTTRYPVYIERGGHWDARPTPNAPPRAVRLVPETAPLHGVCHVPAGPARLGGDPAAVDAHPARDVWLDDFVIQQAPVTNDDYLAFITDLVAAGRHDDAIRWAPKVQRGGDADTTYTWSRELPVVMIDWHAAKAYAEWRAARDRLPWRLPTEAEWEKAARGVDARYFPWGDHHDPTLCNMRDRPPTARPLVAPEAHPADSSPYGVRGLGGNTRDWTAEPFDHEAGPTAPRAVRGGAWSDSADGCRAASRFPVAPTDRRPTLGLRLVRSIFEPVSGD